MGVVNYINVFEDYLNGCDNAPIALPTWTYFISRIVFVAFPNRLWHGQQKSNFAIAFAYQYANIH